MNGEISVKSVVCLRSSAMHTKLGASESGKMASSTVSCVNE